MLYDTYLIGLGEGSSQNMNCIRIFDFKLFQNGIQDDLRRQPKGISNTTSELIDMRECLRLCACARLRVRARASVRARARESKRQRHVRLTGNISGAAAVVAILTGRA